MKRKYKNLVVNETYGNGDKTLLSVIDATDFVLKVECEVIYGVLEKEVCAEYAFQGSRNTLSSITFPEGSKLKTINDCAFAQCKKLSAVDFSNCNYLTSIGIKAFYECSILSNVILPTNLEIVSMYCFGLCDLRSINIPNNVKELKFGCF